MAITITPSPFGSVTVTLDGELAGTLSVNMLATSNSVLNMDLGVPGPQGEAGAQGEPGANGVGVPTGGNAGQVLAKIDGTNYNTEWVDGGAGGDYLPLSGGTLTGTTTVENADLNITNGNFNLTNPSAPDWIFYLGDGFQYFDTETTFETAITPSEIKVGSQTSGLYTRLNGTGIQFPDSSVQTTAGLPLTGGTVTGNVSVYDPIGSPVEILLEIGNGILVVNNDTNESVNISSLGIGFPDSTSQSTAFPPAGGTSAQYIDGTGALTTFPTSIKTASQMVTSVRNNTGATLTKGTVVYINGAVGNKPTVTKAQANSEATSKATYGFVESGIANNADGNVVVIGLLENIDTQGFSDGTQIFLSPTTAGGFTSTQPFSPYHYVRLGTVIRGNHPTQGSIEVNIQNGFQLDEMSDVGATSPTNNNVLTWVSASSQWLDRSISTILGYTPANGTDYLAKADNLSGLASTSTARTNLGLGAVATDAYATTAQAQAGTSTTTVVSPATLLDAKYFQGGRNISQVTWLTATSGTGATSGQNQNRRDIAAPTTAIGTAVSYAFLSNASRGSSVTSSFNWAKRIQFGARLNRNVASPDANTMFRFSIGKSTQAGGDLSERGIMVKQTAGGALQLQVHNGTTLASAVTSSFTPTNQQAYDLLVVSDGAGNATLYVNDVSVATSTGGPTTAGAVNTHQINLTVENTAIITGSPMVYQVSDVFFQNNL